MKQILFLLFAVIFFVMCDQKKTGKNNSLEIKEESLVENELFDEETAQLDSALLFEDNFSRARLIASYDSVISIDTTLIIGSDTMNISFRHHCLFDSAIEVSEEYYYGKNGLVSHNFASELVIKQQDSVLQLIPIKKEDFNVDDILTEELLTKGSLLFGAFRGVNENGVIEVHYSITIPATDIGIGVSALINKEGELNVVES
jgi:hypothetical protein